MIPHVRVQRAGRFRIWLIPKHPDVRSVSFEVFLHVGGPIMPSIDYHPYFIGLEPERV